MNVFDQVRIIIYRINKKGLEIFLVNSSDGNWEFPSCAELSKNSKEILIELDPVEGKDGQLEWACAVEGDWHDIPSIRALVKEDVKIVADQLSQMLPEMEQGTFFAVKEAFKKVMPEQYAFLKELKDIILDRNQVKYI